MVPVEPARLRLPGRCRRDRTGKAMGSTLRPVAIDPEVLARDMEFGPDEEVPLVVPELAEFYLLGVAQQPGGLVVACPRIAELGRGSQGYRNGLALRAEATTRWGWVGMGHKP